MIDRRTPTGMTRVELLLVSVAVLPLVAILIAQLIPPPRQSMLHQCQENQAKIDGAIQQYILEHKLPGPEALRALAGSEAWKKLLVGPDNYLRELPRCPNGGTYVVFASDDEVHPAHGCGNAVYCTLYATPGGMHVYGCS